MIYSHWWKVPTVLQPCLPVPASPHTLSSSHTDPDTQSSLNSGSLPTWLYSLRIRVFHYFLHRTNSEWSFRSQPKYYLARKSSLPSQSGSDFPLLGSRAPYVYLGYRFVNYWESIAIMVHTTWVLWSSYPKGERETKRVMEDGWKKEREFFINYY